MNNLTPIVSVVIPAYNCERYIAETINSVLNQTYNNLDVIVVDDESTDRTRDVVRSFGGLVKLITQPNSGVCVARNNGIRESIGEYVCLMDHDDYWIPEKLEIELSVFYENSELGLVFSDFTLWEPLEDGSHPSPNNYMSSIIDDSIDQNYSGWIYHTLLMDCWILTSTSMIRSEVFDRCGLYDENIPYSEDWDLWLRISQEYPMAKIKMSTTLYRQHRAQGSRKIRNIDYRTDLLYKAVRKWGLCSRDGRCISNKEFNENIAVYHIDHAFSCLKANRLLMANNSFIKAWLKHPRQFKYLVYIPATLLGWRPDW